VEVTDVLCEEASRRDLGGLTRVEYLMHFLMAGLRFGWVVPLLFGRPSVGVARWSRPRIGVRIRSWMLITGASIGDSRDGELPLFHVVLARAEVPAGDVIRWGRCALCYGSSQEPSPAAAIEAV
jgi:hypothetical protein